MADPGKQATFNVKIEGDAKAPLEQADALEKLRAGIESSQSLIRQYSADMKLLRGSSEQVTKAKLDLKSKIDAERDSVSRSNLALLKLGGSYTELAKKSKEASKGSSDIGKAIATIGGPAQDIRSKFDSLKGVFSEVTSASAASVLGFAATLAIVTALAVGVVGLVAAFASLAIESANALRSMALEREAMTGSAAASMALGHQVEALAQKLALPKSAINAITVSMAEALDGTKVSGQGIEDAIEAVAVTTAAGAHKATSAIQSIIDRGKLWGRTGVGLFELKGMGLGPNAFFDVAQNLAKNLRVGVKEAQNALLAGIAPVDAVAAALKDTVNKRFGEVNAKKLLDVNVTVAKFKENIQGLFTYLAESPGFQVFLVNLKKASDLFSDTTATGRALRVAIGAIGDVLGALSTAILPTMKTLLELVAVGLLKFANTALDAALYIVKTHPALLKVDTILNTLRLTMIATGVVMAGLTIAAVAFAAPFIAAAAAVTLLIDQLAKLHAETNDEVVDASGKVIRTGGVGSRSVTQAVIDNAPMPMNAEGGMVRRPAPGEVVASVAPGEHIVPEGSQVEGRGGGSTPAKIEVHFNIDGGDAHQTAALLRSSGALSEVTHAIELALQALGIPTQSPEVA